MGKLVWNDLARLIAMASATYVIWANIWGLYYRKFMLDAIGGRLGPSGIIPPQSSAFFIAIIVKAPALQIVNIVLGLLSLAIEWPLKYLEYSRVRRSFPALIGLYFFISFTALLVYQSADASLFYLIACGLYFRAHSLGEMRPSTPRAVTGTERV